MKNNILIITGGTGGHVIPALNFFNYLKNQNKNNKIFFLTDYRGFEYLKDFNKKEVLKIKSSHLSGNIFFKLVAIIKLLIGFLQSVLIFIKYRPKIIISFGSYASFTPLLCFIFFKFIFNTRLYIHEQNSIIGQTNKFFLKFAKRIFVNFDKKYNSIKKFEHKISIVGLPQRFSRNYFYNTAINKDKFIFLIFAGSQGSLDIIDIFVKILEPIKKITISKKIKFYIQCPYQKQKEIENLLSKYNFDFEIKSFFNNFQNILKITNLAICRSGAGTIDDLINFKIPAIISPLPSAKDNHQYENAKILSDIDCGIIINKNNMDIDKIILFISKVINDKNFNKSLLSNYSKIIRHNSSELIWKIINDD